MGPGEQNSDHQKIIPRLVSCVSQTNLVLSRAQSTSSPNLVPSWPQLTNPT